MDRRGFLRRSVAALAAGCGASVAAGCGVVDGGWGRGEEADRGAGDGEDAEWTGVRGQFPLSSRAVHMSALVLASNPRPVREAIARYRGEIDARPTDALEELWESRTAAVRRAAADYLGGRAREIALTDSTTAGLALVYHGLRLRPGDEVVTTEHDHLATYGSVRLAAERAGASVRKVRLYERPASATVDEVVSNLSAAIRPETRLLAITWVHSDTGLELPMPEIAKAVARANRDREEEERVLVGLDAVHGMGVEEARAEELGCDFFIAGCHKWLFGPRGTGVVWARPEAWERCAPVSPSFIDAGSWDAWMEGSYPPRPTTATSMSPGGFPAFEHRWAVADAFEFHRKLGRKRVAERTRALARRLKEGLREMPHIHLHTPMDARLSAGIVCFEVEGMDPGRTIARLRERRVIGTTSPYRTNYARLSPAIYNTEREVDLVLREVRALA